MNKKTPVVPEFFLSFIFLLRKIICYKKYYTFPTVSLKYRVPVNKYSHNANSHEYNQKHYINNIVKSIYITYLECKKIQRYKKNNNR